MRKSLSELTNNDIPQHLPYFVFGFILFIIFLYFQITNNGLMIWYGDSFEQQLSFYLGGWEKFRSFDFSLWNWSLGLGANYLSYVFYFASSPFFFITLLFPKEWIPYLFLYLNLLKLGLILVFTFQWLLHIRPERWIALTGSIALTFSGWVIFFFHYNHFLDAFVFYPLILWLIERWIRTKHYFLLALSIGLLGITNYYFLYMFVPFIGLYTVYRLGVTHDHFPWKRLINMIGIGILGVGISGVLLLPSMSLILKTPRLTETTSLFAHISLKDLYRYLSTFLSPVMERFDPSYFLSTEVHNGLGWGGGVSLNLLMITPLLLPISFFSKETKERNYRIAFYGLLAIFTFFLIFYRLFQGSLDVRWYYMITLVNTVSVVEGLSIIDGNRKIRKLLFLFSLVIIGTLIGMFLISQNRQWIGSLKHFKSLEFLMLFLSTLLLLHVFILYYKPKLIWISILFEALIVFFIPLYQDKPMSELDLNLTHYQNTAAIDYIKGNDSGFYRILNDTVLYSSPNEPFAKQYNGLSFYLSLYNFEQEDYLSRLKGTWSMPQTFGRFQSYNLLSTKYFVTRDHTHAVPFGFDFVKRIGSEYIYKNRYYYPLGYATSKTLKESNFMDLSYLNQDRVLMDTIITSESMNTTPIYFNELIPLFSWTEPNDISIPLTPYKQNIYIESFDIPSVTIKTYGETSRLYDQMLFDQYTWQYNYTGLHINENSGIDRIMIQFNNQYQSPTLVNVYLEPDLEAYDNWYSKIQKNMFTNVIVDGDIIEARMDIVENDSWVFTSIPYDKGWSVEIDGKKIEYDKVNLGFIGFKLNSGSYDIRFSYTPPFMQIGFIVSFISLAALILFTWKNNRNSILVRGASK